MQAHSPTGDFGPAQAIDQHSSFLSDRDQNNRRLWLWRLFGVIWIVNLGIAWDYLRSSELSTVQSIAGWSGFVLFAVCYVGSLLIGHPIWSDHSDRARWAQRAVIALMLIINIGFYFAARDSNFAYLFIFPMVLAGLYLPAREAYVWIAAGGLLVIAGGILADASPDDIGDTVLITVGLSVNAVFLGALMVQNRALRRARAEIARLAVSQERLRFARDLHDLLGQSLTLIALKSEIASQQITKDPAHAAIEIADIKQVARTSLQEVRDAVTGYRAPSLRDETTRAREMLGAAGIAFSAQLSGDTLPADCERSLGWFVREGATNIIRHATATSATLTVHASDHLITAELLDNGDRRGRSRDVSPVRVEGTGGNGLQGLAERIEAAGGSLMWEPIPGHGFRLFARFPRLVDAHRSE